MKKQLFAGLLALLLLLSCFAGCAKKDPHEGDALYTEHFSVNRDVFSFFFTESYYSFCNTYSSYLSYLFDTTKPLGEQNYSDGYAESVLGEKYDGTWLDYFTDEGIALARQVLQYCEAAYAEGMGFTEEDDQRADEFENDLKELAKDKGVSVDKYVREFYGEYATLEGMKTASRLTTLAGRYTSVVTDRMTDAVTDEMIEEYYAENAGIYETSDYYQYPLITPKSGDLAKDEEAIGEMTETANRIKAATGTEDFLRLVREDLYPEAAKQAREQYYDVLYKSLSAQYSGEELVAEIEKQLETLTETLLSNAMSAVKQTDVTYDEAQEIGNEAFAQWLYNGGAKTGDVRSIITEDEENYYIILVCVISVPERDENQLYRVGMVIFDGSDAGTVSADVLYDRFRAREDKSADLLKQFGDEYSPLLSQVVETYYDGYCEGAYKLTAVDKWFANAKEGDVGQLSTKVTSGSNTMTYNVVLYKEAYVNVGWRYVARHDLISSLCNEWYAEHSDTISVTVHTDICKK